MNLEKMNFKIFIVVNPKMSQNMSFKDMSFEEMEKDECFIRMMAAVEKSKDMMAKHKYESPRNTESKITRQMFEHFGNCGDCEFCEVMTALEDEGFCLDPTCVCSRTFGKLEDPNTQSYIRQVQSAWNKMKQ